MQIPDNNLKKDSDLPSQPTSGRVWSIVAIAVIIAAYLVAGYFDQATEATHQPGTVPSSEQRG